MRRALSSVAVLSLCAVHVGCGGVVADDTAQAQSAAGGAGGTSAGGSSAQAGTSAKAGAGGTTTVGNGGTGSTTVGAGGNAAAGSGMGTGAAAGSGAGAAAGAGGSVGTGTGGSDATGGAGGDTGAGGGDTAGAPGFMTAAHGPYPLMTAVLPNQVIHNVQLVTITYEGWDQKDLMEGFGDTIVQSDWLVAVGAEYGVGKGAHVGKVVMPGPAPAAASAGFIANLIKTGVTNGTIPGPTAAAPSNDFFYLVYFPATTIVNFGGPVSGTCESQGFGGYHLSTQLNGSRLAYGAIPGCQPPDSLQISASHELIEAATDPAQKGYNFADNEAWGAVAGSEVGDACNDLLWHESGYIFQRSWSNAAASAGKEPCVPVLPGLGAFGVTTDKTGVVGVKAGEVVTIVLTGWSENPIGNWSLGNEQYGVDFIVTPKFSTAQINNGFTSNLTFTIPKTAVKNDVGAFFITSTYMTESHLWPIVVQVQ